MRNLRDRHVVAVIDDREVFLDLKFRPDGAPYFVKAEPKAGKLGIGDEVYNGKNYQYGTVTELTPDINKVFVTYRPDGIGPKRTCLVSVKDLRKCE